MTARLLEVVHSGSLHPLENMSQDEALLASGRGPTLRIYGWDPVGLSLGYFQRSSDFEALDDIGEHVVVRRTTGGGAIHHADEITFALIADAADLPREIDASYQSMHAAIGRALASIGVPTRRFGRGTGSASPEHRWCFERPTCHDLVTTRGKIVGSAQRRTGGSTPRVLHHGSIVLRAPRATPGCGAVDEFVEPTPRVRQSLTDALVVEIAAALAMQPRAIDPPELGALRDSAHTEIVARRDRR